jgi:diaminohydroxyphosphoribosylaminopyrimidine deaminase / 5-amino-6-(5-phosphoribosylamino)uracil reductase
VDDEHWMKRALYLAGRGRGRTSPNPLVGAVLAKRGKVVGEGYHEKAGEAHAEIVALRKAGKEARGSTLYINLEPCTHYGRTAPCAPAVIEAGVERAVIGMVDPNPLVKGKGVSSLRKAGMDVRVGILESDCRRLNEAFCKYIVKKEPFVTLKVAATLDGKMASRHGDSKWISNETSRRLVHRLRNEMDAVLVGVGTVLKDAPLLTPRIPGGRDPYRVILDSRLKIPEEARVIGNSSSKTLIVTTGAAPRDKREKLEKRGVRVIVVRSKEGRVSLRDCLSRLGKMGITSLLVEGGSQINGAFLDERLIDKFLLFLSPKVLGDSRALGIFGGKGAAHLGESVPVRELRVRKLDGDILIEGYMEGGRGPCSLES